MARFFKKREQSKGGKEHIEAIQPLRNWVMASSFFASTAILIGLCIVNAAFRNENISKCSQALNLFGTTSPELWLANLMIWEGIWI